MRFSFYLAEEATTPGGVDQQLVNLLHKLYALGQRVIVRCPDVSRAERLSGFLWKTPAVSFAPHATEHEDETLFPRAEQPIYFTTEGGNPSQATVLIRLMGSTSETEEFNEVIEFFGGLEAEKAMARTRWKEVKNAGYDCRLFIQNAGRWTLKT